ncbi:MAG TPA: peptidoglycan DD-metalloendopeptidase family protein [Candidatus Bacteroides intestinavium]|uniref:Peptidoglycan DD-metalloendopeptidase family protein n=1 Tax=Candidatus Bacteroides intestinavium TaxID=2838469 RepID=A0A9D2KRR9_9BACE|nr:peptidoglycan DD-metalloendopeptidase family protein [Candidatus Bacteroides intestinavium]
MKLPMIKTLCLAAMTVFGANAFSQDLIARQAPIDRKLKTVDSLALQKQIRVEQSLYPAFDIYPSWNNDVVAAYKDAIVPESFTFDLTGFCMPTEHTKITDVFGYRPRRRRRHEGLDIKVYVGDTIRAAFDGKVRVVKNQGRRGYGKYLVIRHDNGLETLYGHLSKQLVEVDQLVKAGEPIALGGNTGRSTGSHLHFETRFLGKPLNPALMFDFEKQDIVADTYTFHKDKADSKKGTSPKGLFYKVKKGDTLAKIARRQGTTVSQLCKLNRITRRTILRPGQVLRCS